MSERVWSPQQNAIFGWFESRTLPASTGIGSGGIHLIVRARAGTGKTTTILEGVNRAPERKILLAAFNKRIAVEMAKRLQNPNATAKTLHSVGYAAVCRQWPGVKLSEGSDRADDVTAKATKGRCPEPVAKLISRLHTLGREINPHAVRFGDLTELLYNFECEPEEIWWKDGYDAAYVEDMALKAMQIAAESMPEETGIDFADMIFLPVRNHWLVKTYDLVVVDEAQDMTVAQLEIARGVCRGRICVVGDDRQAIYGFRGADSRSLDRLKDDLQAAELGLTITYRCGRVIVDLARMLVPDFEAAETNPEGLISDSPLDKMLAEANLGDFILSRINAPLVSVAMHLLRNGKRARIAGRDVGAGLKSIIRKLTKGRGGHSIPDLMRKLESWEQREAARYRAAGRNKQADAVHDRAEMLVELASTATSVEDLINRIDILFTDDGLGQAGVITCSSVHKAKGLEADRVFILRDTFRGYGQEEENIQYVAITRAKNHLVWVMEGAQA